MASKLNGWSRDIYVYALFGVLVYVTLITCFHGLHNNSGEQTEANLAKNSARSFNQRRQNNVEEGNGSYFLQQFDKVSRIVYRRIEDAFVTLTVKFLHFFVSRWLQLRYLPALFPAPWTTSMSFWVAFTRSVSSMPDNPL